MTSQYVDSIGEIIAIGDVALIERIPDELIHDLPLEDQIAITRCLGQHFSIVSFDEYGHAEIEFSDSDNNFHTIWINTNCLKKQSEV